MQALLRHHQPAQPSTAALVQQPSGAAALAALRRELRQLDPTLGIAPPPQTAAARKEGAGAVAPPRLRSRDGVHQCLAQLRQRQQQAERMQVSHPIVRPPLMSRFPCLSGA